MKYAKISSDVLFSMWVFIWGLTYYLTKTFYSHPPIPFYYWNPAASLIFALSYQVLVFILALIRPAKHLLKIILTILIITILFKAGPLYLIWTDDIPWINSILSGIFLFCVYYAYIYSKGLTVERIYNTFTEIFMQDEITKRITLFQTVK